MTEKSLFVSDYCLTPHERISEGTILCEDGIIMAIGSASAFDVIPDVKIHDMRGSYAVPGFIDTHIHGAGGFDSSTADEGVEDFNLMSQTLASHGVTSFMPTLVARPREQFLASVSALAKLLGQQHLWAEPVGLHLEGPYLNRKKHGAQHADHIREIDLGEAREIVAEGRGTIKVMTFAPELKDSLELVELLRENDIIPSMGHSLADEKAVLRAIDAGATHCTHLYNGMPILHHRSVGLTGVALTDDRVTVELILDGYHIHPRMVDLVCRAKPMDKIIGVSDAIQAAGLKDGLYHIGKTEIQVHQGRATTKDGVIAGTTLTLERGWRHLATYSRLDNTDAAACLTINPAKTYQLNDRGELLPGRKADISFFDFQTNKPVMTVRDGKVIFKADPKTRLEETGEDDAP